MVCWGVDRTTLDCVQFVNSQVKKLGLSAEALRPDGEVAKSCDSIMLRLEAVMGQRTTTNAQRFMLLHSLGAYREQVILVMRSQNVRLYDDRYQNYDDEDSEQDESEESEDELENLGRRDHNTDRPRPREQNNDGYRNVTQHNNQQQRGNNRAIEQAGQVVAYHDSPEGILEANERTYGPGVRDIEVKLFDPVNTYGRLLRVHYIFNENDMSIDSKYPLADKEREAAFVAAKHLRSTYQDIGLNGGPKSSALIRDPDNLHDAVLPVCDNVWSPMRQEWNNRAIFRGT